MSDISQLRSSFRHKRELCEQVVVEQLLGQLDFDDNQLENIQKYAISLVNNLRDEAKPGLMESFLAQYGLSTEEGIALMCLAEAYLRTPDDLTMDALIRDKIGTGEWSRHRGGADSPFVNVTTWALMLSGKIFKNKNPNDDDLGATMLEVVQRLGEPVARIVVAQAMKLMGRQFVLGRNIDEAIENGKSARRQGYRYSYDMLGEAARTQADAQRYFLSYSKAIASIALHAKEKIVHDNPGISVKLSALHPRYEQVQHNRIMRELVPRMAALCEQAHAANIGLNIDAEEMDRLDISFDVIAAVLRSPSLEGWDGFGVVVQAYSKQAVSAIEWLNQLAIDLDRRISVRLVKGAYWDTEIKNAQVQGLARYPLFTRKQSTDISYLVCARRLLAYSDRIYPQFATHNAQTTSAILELADEDSNFEFQRLHGMGEALHDILKSKTNHPCRIYAPVGIHKDLLAYLVRRLLENGANSSFVNQVLDRDVPVDSIVADPINFLKSIGEVANPKIPMPLNLYGDKRLNSKGWNLNDPLDAQLLEEKISVFRRSTWSCGPIIKGHDGSGEAVKINSPIDSRDQVGQVIQSSDEDVNKAIENAQASFEKWSNESADHRATRLEKTADLIEENTAELIALAIREAGKTRLDSIAEVREAVDFLRYYAQQARDNLKAGQYEALGPVVCISPWNFPLAIFVGQISAALAAGNTVIAKPAEQTALIGARAVELFHQAGVPEEVISLVPGTGAKVGSALTCDPRVKCVCFTGSTATAVRIDLSMATKGDARAPLVAETGGLNAMIVDSSALPEQAVRDIVLSAFQSAGQRCSALRLLIVQEDVADHILEMLEGAAKELVIGDSWNLATDVGPVIDELAKKNILAHMKKLDDQNRCLFKTLMPDSTRLGTYVPVAAYKLDRISDLNKEIFGPVLHVVTFKAKGLEDVVHQINESGYGLTLGAHSRVDARMDKICALAQVGNIYLNRNQIGAVVGVQPFGGEGLSGTGPKAGGPLYLMRFVQPIYSAQNVDSNGEPSPFSKAAICLNEADQAVINTAIARAAQVSATPVKLKGPTGERNTYSMHPRGIIYCAGGGENPQASLLVQTILSTMAGNKIVLSDTENIDATQTVIKYLKAAGVPAGQVLVLSQDPVSICANAEIDMIVSDDSDVKEIRIALANRPGARIVMLTSSAIAALYYIERVVSEDTTASGGNPSLLAGS